jgi:glutamyl-tRNA reductase
MPILTLGVSYRRASVELLEQLAFTDDEYPKAYRRLLEMEPVTEAVILSTCNRTEVYAEVASYHAGFLALKRFLSESREVPMDAFAEPLYSHYEDDAGEHLFEVASGIDSMVLGEPQILTQVRQARRRAEDEGATGPMLSALLRAAIRTGRRARAETGIGASPGTMVETGLQLAGRSLGGLEGRSVLVVGAGGMAALAVAALRNHAIGRLRVVNRSVERARHLAAKAEGEGGGLDTLIAAVAHADLVVSSTGSAGTVIAVESVREARADHADTPLFFLDLAVPRDVDPAVADLPGVELADIDDLKGAVDEAGVSPGTGEEIGRVRDIVREEVRRFASWRRASRMAPLIRALRDRGDRIQAAELARVAPRLQGLSEREREAVEAMAQGIVAKLLHDPIVQLKEASGPGAAELARTLADLFGLQLPTGA